MPPRAVDNIPQRMYSLLFYRRFRLTDTLHRTGARADRTPAADRERSATGRVT